MRTFFRRENEKSRKMSWCSNFSERYYIVLCPLNIMNYICSLDQKIGNTVLFGNILLGDKKTIYKNFHETIQYRKLFKLDLIQNF
jgi:hypothetical protein